MYEHFATHLKLMEDYWWNVIPERLRDFYGDGDNLAKFAENNRDQYDAMYKLATMLDIPV